MAIRKYNPTTPSRRFMTASDFSEMTKSEPEKALLQPLKKKGGRSCQGVITSRHRGGGAKRMYRRVDFKRDKDNVPAKVAAIEYDPNRSARIALLHYADGEKRYILAPDGLRTGEVIMSGENVEARVGNVMPLRNIPLGMMIHNVELQPGRGGQVVRTAGGMAQLSAKEGKYAHVKLPSGEIRLVSLACRAAIGQVGNVSHGGVTVGKAGRARRLGRRPKVRGVAQNPVSHPMGGGEGRSHGGRQPCSPTGKLAKGQRTRRRNNPTNSFIVRRRKK